MNEKNYRVLIMLLIVFALAGGTIFYLWNEKNKEQRTDGIFVENTTDTEYYCS